MRRAAKRDESEKDIVDALRKAGASVVRMDKPVDLLIGFAGATYLAECKTPKTHYGKTLNANQQDFQDSWRGGKVHIFKTPEEALKVLSDWRAIKPVKVAA